MATLVSRISDLATRIATENKALRTLINGNVADLSSLTTTSKTSLVSAINAVQLEIDDLESQIAAASSIDDAATSSTTKTYSIDKIKDLLSESIAALTAGAPTALDTLDELAAALGDDANFAATVTTALGNRLRVDINNQGLTTLQKQNARINLDAYGSEEIGIPDTNFVATFNTGLV